MIGSEFYERVRELVEAGQTFVIAYLIGRTGSAPQRPGAKMLVHPDGRSEFTLGGGTIEAQIIREAAEGVRRPDGPQVNVREYFLGDLGMHCGGLVRVLFEIIQPTEPERSFYQQVCSLQDDKRPFALAHVFPLATQSYCKLACDGVELKSVCGSTALPTPVLGVISRAASEFLVSNFTSDVRTVENREIFFDVINRPPRLLIFGAGHVGRRLGLVAAATGLFQVEIVDDRPEYANRDRLPFSDRIILAQPNYLGGLPKPDERTFVAVITRCHATDFAIMYKLLSNEFMPPYVGMIGSVPKRAKLFKMLRDEGVPQQKLDQVYSPMGLPIGGKDPGEIAISMLAEIIQVKNELEGVREGGKVQWADKRNREIPSKIPGS